MEGTVITKCKLASFSLLSFSRDSISSIAESNMTNISILEAVKGLILYECLVMQEVKQKLQKLLVLTVTSQINLFGPPKKQIFKDIKTYQV